MKKQADDTKLQLNQMRILKEDVEQRLSRMTVEACELRKTLENSQSSSTDQVIRLQKQVKEKDSEMNELYEGQTRLEIQTSQLEGQLATIRDELKTRNA